MFHLHPKTVRRIVAAATLGLLLLVLAVYSGSSTRVSAAGVSAAASASGNALINAQQTGNQQSQQNQQSSTSSILSLTVNPYPTQFTVYEVGQSMTYTVATGTDYVGPGDPITATIDWGDKTTPTQYTFIDGQTFQISGTHAYSKLGKYTLTVTAAITVFQQSVTGTGTVNVVPAYTLTAKNINAKSGYTFTKTIATGTDPFSNDTLNGTINWGDNTTPTNVQITSSSKGIFKVKATHTYSQPGNYTITVSLTSIIVGPISQTGTATVLAQQVIF